jgi:hypothetical protein
MASAFNVHADQAMKGLDGQRCLRMNRRAKWLGFNEDAIALMLSVPAHPFSCL